MSDRSQTFAELSRGMGIAVTRQSLLRTWQKLQAPYGELPGMSAAHAAEVLGSDLRVMLMWQAEYEEHGLEGLAD